MSTEVAPDPVTEPVAIEAPAEAVSPPVETPAEDAPAAEPAEPQSFDEMVDEFFAEEAKKGEEETPSSDDGPKRDSNGRFVKAEPEAAPAPVAIPALRYKVDGAEREAPPLTPENEAWYRERLEKGESFDQVIPRRQREAVTSVLQDLTAQIAAQGYILAPDPSDPINKVVIVPKPGTQATSTAKAEPAPDPNATEGQRIAALKAKAASEGLNAEEVVELFDIQERRTQRILDEMASRDRKAQEHRQQSEQERIRAEFSESVGKLIIDRAKSFGESADDIGRAAWSHAVMLSTKAQKIADVRDEMARYFDRLDKLRAAPQPAAPPAAKPAAPAPVPAKAAPPVVGAGVAPRDTGRDPLAEKNTSDWTDDEWASYFSRR